jgi:hypothetical protein
VLVYQNVLCNIPTGHGVYILWFVPAKPAIWHFVLVLQDTFNFNTRIEPTARRTGRIGSDRSGSKQWNSGRVPSLDR